MKVTSRRLARIALVATATVLGVAGVAAATGNVFGAGGTLFACANSNEGQLRLVETAGACRSSEQAVQWNVRGEPGPPGPGLETLEDLEGKPCEIADRQGEVVFSRSVPPLGGYLAVTTLCMTADRFEPNETRATAADLTGVLPQFGVLPIVGATIYPAGDEDWFVVRRATFRRVNINLGLVVDVYRDGELVGDDLEAPTLVDDGAAPHDWELHIRSKGGPAPIIITLSPF